MAIVFVAGGHNGTANTGTALTVTATITANDTAVVITEVAATSAVVSVVDTGGSVYSKQASISNGTFTMEIWSTAVGAAKASTSVTITYGTTHVARGAAVGDYSGVVALGITNTASGSASPATVSLTTQDANNFVVAGLGTSSATTQTFTAQNGSIRETTTLAGSNGTLVDNTAASPSSVTDSATYSVAGNWAAVALELRSTSGGGGSVIPAQSYPVCLRMG
ncbi:MAG TPA: hypothetical protein VFI60_05650 [Candidatus Acidoferrum sp.]|nr:hypothetical protein [Candidatus Acidoferrum sp.]